MYEYDQTVPQHLQFVSVDFVFSLICVFEGKIVFEYMYCPPRLTLRPTFLFKLIYKPADCNFRKSGKKIKYHSDGYIFIFSAAYSDIHFV